MKTFRFIAAAAIAAAAIPTMAQAEPAAPASTFTRNGVTYTYTVETKGALKILRGTDGDKTFALLVRDNHVSGTYGSGSVDFRLPKTKIGQAEVLAAR